MQKKGVDISTFNGDVDMAALKREVDFVIIRCGYGSDYRDQDDVQYWNNIKKCQQYNMPYGVYLYSYATNQAMAASEAKHSLRLLAGTDPSYGVWYDIEDPSLPTDAGLVDQCVTYCDLIKQAGYHSGIYASLSFWNHQLNSPRLDVYDKWVAQWADAISYQKPFGIWQYTDQGRIGGKIFDMNLAYRSYPPAETPPETGGQGGTEGGNAAMTQADFIKLAREQAAQVFKENEEKYKLLSDVPEWAKAQVMKIYNRLGLSGTGETDSDLQLDASADYIRMLIVLSKMLDYFEQQPDREKPAEP